MTELRDVAWFHAQHASGDIEPGVYRVEDGDEEDCRAVWLEPHADEPWPSSTRRAFLGYDAAATEIGSAQGDKVAQDYLRARYVEEEELSDGRGGGEPWARAALAADRLERAVAALVKPALLIASLARKPRHSSARSRAPRRHGTRTARAGPTGDDDPPPPRPWRGPTALASESSDRGTKLCTLRSLPGSRP